MNRFGKLLNFELNRFLKIYIVLIGITIISQLVGVIVKSKNYLKLANEEIYINGVPMASFISLHGMMDMFKVLKSMWFMGPIALSVAALIFYMFLIWYRDWFGKNTFIYRLLMIPTARLNVFLAKATAIMIMVIGLVSIQLILLPIESRLLKWMVPLDFRDDYSVIEIIRSYEYLQVIIPQTFTEFILYYGIGFMVIVVLFTIILFERSFRIKGLVMGIVYGALSVTVFLTPVISQRMFDGRLFHPIETIILEIVAGIIIITGSILLSGFLLKNKVTV